MRHPFAVPQNIYLLRFFSATDTAKLRIGGPLAPSSTRCSSDCLHFTRKTVRNCTKTLSMRNQSLITISWRPKLGTFVTDYCRKTQVKDQVLSQEMLTISNVTHGLSKSTGTRLNKSCSNLLTNLSLIELPMLSTSHLNSRSCSHHLLI